MGISMNGFDELIIAFDELSEMPDSVLDGMLEAGAKVVERVTRKPAKATAYIVPALRSARSDTMHRARRQTARLCISIRKAAPRMVRTRPNAMPRSLISTNTARRTSRRARSCATVQNCAAGEAVQQEEQKFNDYLTSKGL